MDSVATIVGVVAALIIIGIGYMITKASEASEASEPVEAAVAVNGEGSKLCFFFGLFFCSFFMSFFYPSSFYLLHFRAPSLRPFPVAKLQK